MKLKLIALSLFLSMSSMAFERSCVKGSGFFTSEVTFLHGNGFSGPARCRVGDSSFGSGTWSQNGFNVFVNCDIASYSFVTNLDGSILTDSSGGQWTCFVN